MPTKRGPDRIPCEIVGCGRTFQRKPEDAPDVRVMCGKHFRLAPSHMRRRLAKLRRRLDRAKTQEEWQRVATICTRMWDRIRERSMQIALGISR